MSARAPGFAVPDGHHTADRRSLAMHRAIADSLTDEQLERARHRVTTWLEDGSVDLQWAGAWARILAGSRAEVATQIVRDDAEMVQLRQSTPFAGALPNATRWQILREVR